MHIDTRSLSEIGAITGSLTAAETMPLADLEGLYRDVRRIVTSDIQVLTPQGAVKLSDALASPHQGRWKRYWVDPEAMPLHPDMNMAGHLVRTEKDISAVTSLLPSGEGSLRTKVLLHITGWIHDLGELVGGDELFQSIDLSSRQMEKAAFYSLIPTLFGELSADAQSLLRELYDSVALPLQQEEKHPVLEPLFECVERLGYLQTALEVAVSQPRDVLANLLSTSVFHYHQRWFSKEVSINPILKESLDKLASLIRIALCDKKNNSERTRSELQAELELEVALGKRVTVEASDLDISFPFWWAACEVATGDTAITSLPPSP